MKRLARWATFNMVGAMGMLVQLAALALFQPVLGRHYAFATAAAIEVALLHNFVWHWHYTWRDRREDAALLRRLVRFHLSNGMVSILGNLVLMQLLVGVAHLMLLPSNFAAIVCCSAGNYFLADHWGFRGSAIRAKQLGLSNQG